MPKNVGMMRPNLLSDLSILDAKRRQRPGGAQQRRAGGRERQHYLFVLDATRDNEAKARKVMVRA
jgi:hypothetical protein